MTTDFNDLVHTLMDSAYSDGADANGVPWPSDATLAARDALLAAIGAQQQAKNILEQALDQLVPGNYRFSAMLRIDADKNLLADEVRIEAEP